MMGTTLSYSKEATSLKKGLYEHFKGKRYEVLGICRHSETLEEYVIYKALYGSMDTWIRPLKMFCETVRTPTGTVVPRFRFVGAELTKD